jgi:phospholipid/cholesterol/gamma-HCH transport system substrate-binding protein
MSPYRRNLLVGVTVLTALVVLGWMMLRFGAWLAWPFAPQYVDVHLRSERADGLFDGSAVYFRGVQVGRVKRIYRPAESPLTVMIDAEVDHTPPIPRNVRGIISTTNLIGGGAGLNLELIGEKPEGEITPGTLLEAEYVGSTILPPEFADLARELRAVAQHFRESNLVAHLDEEVRRIGEVVSSIQQIVDDPKMREDLRASLGNIRTMTEKADRIAGRLEGLTEEASQTLTQARGTIGKTETEVLSVARNMNDQLTQLGKLIDQFQQISQKVEKGQGTAGALVNDPRLYETMVDTARQMQMTVADLRRLIQQWEEEGVSLKLR